VIGEVKRRGALNVDSLERAFADNPVVRFDHANVSDRVPIIGTVAKSLHISNLFLDIGPKEYPSKSIGQDCIVITGFDEQKEKAANIESVIKCCRLRTFEQGNGVRVHFGKCTISNCHISDSDSFLRVKGASVTVEGTMARNLSGLGVSLEDEGTEGKFVDCKFINIQRYGIMQFGKSKSSLVSHCEFMNCGHDDPDSPSCALMIDCGATRVEHSLFHGISTFGMSVEGVSDVVVEHNTFTKNQYGLSISCSGVTASVKHNEFIGHDVGAMCHLNQDLGTIVFAENKVPLTLALLIGGLY